jgi:diacylglycerol O-acyltransferase / wax synthase
MQNHQSGDRLSWGDSVFLNLERDGMPLNVAGVSILEGEIPFDAFLQFVESKLSLIPRYLKRLTAPTLNVGLPTWDYDPDFDIRNHVREASLKHGSDAELKALAGKILSKVMNRQHPLWDMTLVHGLKRNRTALIARMHHCLADGIAGVGIMGTFMNESPAVPVATPPPARKKPRLRVPPPRGRDAVGSLVDGMVDSYINFTERVLSAWTGILNITERTVANGGNLASDEFSHLLPELTAPTERLCFNVIYRGPQKFGWTEIPLEAVKAIRCACGTSVNDVLLALITATIRRYSELRGDKVKKRLLRIMVPVNLRSNGSPSGMGNHISLVPVTIPLDIRDPKKLLEAVHARTEFLKRTHAAEVIGLAGGLIGILPSPMQAFAGPMISRLPITPFNMVCTSVPGPQAPLYVLGHQMLHWYPYVPVGGELALNCAVLSYNGVVYFGFSADKQVVPDIGRLEKFLKLSFTELQIAAGVEAAPKKRVHAKKRVSPNPAALSTSAGDLSIPPAVAGVSPESTTIPEPGLERAAMVKSTGH